MDKTGKSPLTAPEPLQWGEVWPGDPEPGLPKLLVIPDLHGRTENADHWLEQKFDTAVLLGDYFDSPGDTPDDARKVAVWLRERLDDPRLIFLVGNHDGHYLFPRRRELVYPGFTTAKATAINSVLKRKHWARMRVACTAGNYLLSHSGFSRVWISPPTLENILARCKLAEERLARGVYDAIFGYGDLPGGLQKFGGPIAGQDFENFHGIAGINQMVGHTPGSEVRVKPEGNTLNICLDVRTAAVAAMVQGDHVEILRMPSPATALQVS